MKHLHSHRTEDTMDALAARLRPDWKVQDAPTGYLSLRWRGLLVAVVSEDQADDLPAHYPQAFTKEEA